MARISTYINDTTINDEDLLTGSNFIRIGEYNTRNYKLVDLAEYFANFQISDNQLYNFATISQQATTNVSDIEASAAYSLNLAAQFGTFDTLGNLVTLSSAFANQVLTVTTNARFAESTYAENLASTFGTFDTDGNLTSLSEAFANNVMTTTASGRFAESTYVTNLGSSFGTLASDGSVTISEAFADSVITTTASDRFATTTSVDTLTSTVSGKPDIFRQDDAPPVTKPVGSIWYDTNDNNKVYVLIAGTPNVWTLTADDRIITNSTSISNVTQSVTTLSNSLGAEASLIDELQTQFTFDTNGGITGTADALATSITTASSNAAGAVATDLDKLETQFTFDSNGDVSGVADALNTSISTASSTAAGAVATDLDKLEAVFTFDSNNNVNGVSGALNTSINTAASTASDAVASDLNKLETVFSFDSNGDVDGIQGSLATAVTSNANTAISNASLASASEVNELKTQFVFDSNGSITGVADALSTSITNTASSEAGSVATDLDKLEAVFSFDSNNDVDGISGALSTAVTSNANTAITNASLASAADVTEIQSQFAFTNGEITGVADALASSITTTASTEAGSVASDLDKLEAVFSFDANGDVDGTAGALSTAVASSATTAIANANLASAQSVTDLTSTVDTKPQIFRQNAEPGTTGVPNNSLWYDTNDNNKLYVLISSTWTATVDGTIAIAHSAAGTAQQAADTAQSTADGRPKVFRQNNAPATSEPASSIWYDTNDDNKIYILVGTTWTATDDPRIATNSANISTQQTVTTRLDGHSKAAYSLTANANNVVTGMQIIAANNQTSSLSEVKFQADKFIVNSSTTNLTPFSISGSKIKFNGDIDVTGTALIQGTDTTNNEFTAVKIINTGSTNGKVGMKLQNSSGYFAQFFLDTTTENNINNYGFDLQLGPASGGGVNTVAHFNAGGLCVPAGTSTDGNYNGRSIFFNSDNAAVDSDSGRMHVNNYFKTFFLDIPTPRTDDTWADKGFVMRRWNSGNNSSQEVLSVKTATRSLHVVGDIVASETSDKRLKDNIKPIQNACEKINKIGGYEFDWNDKQKLYEGHDVGVIAQEIEEVLPEVVETREDGYKAVDYKKIVPLLIQAIKEQQKQINELKKQ
jgi:uncharacterized Zn-binding protein involved in type VI secretion